MQIQEIKYHMSKCTMVIAGLIFTGCFLMKDGNQEGRLNEGISNLEKLLGIEKFDYEEVTRVLSLIDSCLIGSEDKSLDNGRWNTEAKFKSNQDSSIVMIHADKRHKNGFKRETILQIRDTVLFIWRFEVLTDNEYRGYELLETFDYLSKERNIKTLVRREYPRPLSDTVYFRSLPFQRYEGDGAKQFDFELQYARRIMNGI